VSDAYAGEKRYVRRPQSEHNDLIEGEAIGEYQAALDWLWERAAAERPATAETAPVGRNDE
jgi:hypothetical protein